ncbi:hypothetical protein N7488_010443 [Penicillium malachiteum]|nr:hypothetical protein N7488_010443 [Penicillium malachiteum]
MRVVPASATTVTTEYQVFRNPASPEDIFQGAADFFEGIELEDYDLCSGVQKNLNSGVYVHGPLHTNRESGVMYFKNFVKAQLEAHLKQESAVGHEIWPARRDQQLHSKVSGEENIRADVCACGLKGGCS